MEPPGVLQDKEGFAGCGADIPGDSGLGWEGFGRWVCRGVREERGGSGAGEQGRARSGARNTEHGGM